TYPSYALNLAQLGALCISNLCATKPFCNNNIGLFNFGNDAFFSHAKYLSSSQSERVLPVQIVKDNNRNR
ncbi:hypothetical protein Q8H44_13230, partial [Acinetobacter lwoffii]|uniref:hypothetical protein n=1 Tax=Acinetobacter lwoffii TaxID=28090 RepID=UPI002730D55E